MPEAIPNQTADQAVDYLFEGVSLASANPYLAAAMIVSGLLLLRLQYPQRFHMIPWSVVRRIAYPVIQRRIERGWGGFPDADLPEEQHLETVDQPPAVVQRILEENGFTIEPLAAYRQDCTGANEHASLAYHYGPKLFPGAPSWLRERQVHVRLYPRDGGSKTALVGHDEYNSWRPDLVEEHLTDATMAVEPARTRVRKALGQE